mmetsp:Transcript_4341/g.9849  ORF Transcript_4341/g.9849 Transcript_4341/m.9849 type:complete len:205 (-) Transcript_4341:349-963(-)
MDAPPTFLSIGSCFAMAIYGADAPPVLRRRYGCRIPLSRADHAVLLFVAAPALPVERLVDFLLYDFFLLFLAGAFLFLVLVVADSVVFDVDDDADAVALFLFPPAEVAAFLDDWRGFLLLAVTSESSPFLWPNRTPFTPAPDPPMTSFRVVIHEKESDAFRVSVLRIAADRRRCQEGSCRADGEGSGRRLSTSDNDESEPPSIV